MWLARYDDCRVSIGVLYGYAAYRAIWRRQIVTYTIAPPTAIETFASTHLLWNVLRNSPKLCGGAKELVPEMSGERGLPAGLMAKVIQLDA